MVLIESTDLKFFYIWRCPSLGSDTDKPLISTGGTKLSFEMATMLAVKPDSFPHEVERVDNYSVYMFLELYETLQAHLE